MIEQGKGCKANSIKAFKLYYRSAKQGNAFGQNAVGMYLLNSKSHWYLPPYCLGQMFMKGKGCLKNKTKAQKWFQRSANQGNAMGQYNLGIDIGIFSLLKLI